MQGVDGDMEEAHVTVRALGLVADHVFWQVNATDSVTYCAVVLAVSIGIVVYRVIAVD